MTKKPCIMQINCCLLTVVLTLSEHYSNSCLVAWWKAPLKSLTRLIHEQFPFCSHTRPTSKEPIHVVLCCQSYPQDMCMLHSAQPSDHSLSLVIYTSSAISYFCYHYVFLWIKRRTFPSLIQKHKTVVCNTCCCGTHGIESVIGSRVSLHDCSNRDLFACCHMSRLCIKLIAINAKSHFVDFVAPCITSVIICSVMIIPNVSIIISCRMSISVVVINDVAIMSQHAKVAQGLDP